MPNDYKKFDEYRITIYTYRINLYKEGYSEAEAYKKAMKEYTDEIIYIVNYALNNGYFNLVKDYCEKYSDLMANIMFGWKFQKPKNFKIVY